MLGFAAPIAGVLVLVAHYGTNLILDDQWDDVTVIQSSYGHFPDWTVLWHQHNENRLFFPNLIVIALAHLDHFNIVVEEFLGAVMLIVAHVILILAHRRRSRRTPWIYYCPVMLVGLGITQWQNLLWGFQMAWFLVLLSLAATIYLLDRVKPSWPYLAGAIATAIVGSYSSLQGLTIWAAGLVLLFYRRRPARTVTAWVISAVAVVALYYYNFPSALGLRPSLAATHPLASLKFVVFELGDI
ncbi:MAG TPA: hypothetical protein VE991_15110, partial [Acidimicrobiales bacterium]|nr:hypothetical protein [Acidimicrobiales bacterium]